MPRGTRNARPRGIHPDLIPTLAEELTHCRDDLSRFNDVILGGPSFWHRQEEICRSVVECEVTACPTGNGVGKSFVGARILLAWLTTRPGSRAIVAAPTAGQLSGVLWAEMQAARTRAEKLGLPLGGRVNGLTLDYGDGWTLEGFGQGSVEARSGRHAGDLLAVVDEASGTKPAVLEAIDSLNPSRYLYLGNPLRSYGKFFEVCERPGPHVNVIRIPSLESPDIHLPRSDRGMADAGWLARVRHEYGEESIWWLSHVLALFPGEAAELLLPPAWLALAGKTIHARAGRVRLGVDVAKGTERDDSMIVARDDTGVLGAWWSNRWDLEQLAGQVALHAADLDVAGPSIAYDATGIGADFGNRLASKGLHGARDYMGSRSGGEKFSNLRSAAGWLLRRRLDPARSASAPGPGKPRGFRDRVELDIRRKGEPEPDPADPDARIYTPQRPFSIPQHLIDAFRPELSIRYQLDDAGRIQLEVKEDLIARLKRSPNFLDALIMTFAYP